MVAPLVGAWIEMSGCSCGIIYANVAPLVGAWIEILGYKEILEQYASLPSWERGLKLEIQPLLPVLSPSLPSWERGLKSVIGGAAAVVHSRSPRGSVD